MSAERPCLQIQWMMWVLLTIWNMVSISVRRKVSAASRLPVLELIAGLGDAFVWDDLQQRRLHLAAAEAAVGTETAAKLQQFAASQSAQLQLSSMAGWCGRRRAPDRRHCHDLLEQLLNAQARGSQSSADGQCQHLHGKRTCTSWIGGRQTPL